MKAILKRYWYYLMFIIFFATSVLTTGILAKYTYNDGESLVLTDSPMYFTVDLIQNVYGDDDVNTLEHTLYGGDSRNLSFNVLNYFDEYRITEYDITYSVKVENTSSLESLKAFNDFELVLESGSSKLTKNTQDAHKYQLKVGGSYESGTQLTVTVTASAPFKKEMKMVFNLVNSSNTVNYYIDDGADSLYAELVIYSDIDISEDKIIIDWSDINKTKNIFQIDSTSPYIDLSDVDGRVESGSYVDSNGNTITTYYYNKAKVAIELKENMSISIIFFKVGEASGKDFSTSSHVSVVPETDGTYKIILTNPTV